MWTHGNATKHMHEAILSLKDDPKLKDTNPKLYTQFILFDYWKSLGLTVKNGIRYDKKLTTGSWEFIFQDLEMLAIIQLSSMLNLLG